MRRRKGRGISKLVLLFILCWIFYQALYGGWTYFRLHEEKIKETQLIERLKIRKIIYQRRLEYLKTEEGMRELAKRRLRLLLSKRPIKAKVK